jgi:hypothetical protein
MKFERNMLRFFICNVSPSETFVTLGPVSRIKLERFRALLSINPQLPAKRNLQALELQQHARYLQAYYLPAGNQV